MRSVVLALVLAVLPCASRAQEGRPGPFSVGVRLGYGIAMGTASRNVANGLSEPMTNGFKAQAPAVQLEGSYAIRRFAVGAYVSYAFDSIGSELSATCADTAARCAASTVRLGVQGLYRLVDPGRPLVPWAGLGTGWEWTKNEAGGTGFEQAFDGWEIVSLQAGADWRLGPKFTVGPFLQLAVSRFSNVETKEPGFAVVHDSPAVHEWLTLGIRATLGI